MEGKQKKEEVREEGKEVRDEVFFFQAEDGIRDYDVTGVQTCALPILLAALKSSRALSLSRVNCLPPFAVLLGAPLSKVLRLHHHSLGQLHQEAS